MSVVKHFIEDSIKKTQIDEFLQREFERAGYGGVSITKTPLGTHLVIYTMRPGMVIGRGGETIRELAKILEEQFQLPSPQISVAEIEVPELNAFVVASKIASALKRGVHYRRAGFWGLNQAMEAGALGVEIIISGKLRTDRARYEKFRAGYLPKSGEPPRRFMRKAELHVQLKPGVLGVKVNLIPPDAEFPDQVKVLEVEEEFEDEAEKELMEEAPISSVETAEPEAAPAEEVVAAEEEKAVEPVASPSVVEAIEPVQKEAVEEAASPEEPVEAVEQPSEPEVLFVEDTAEKKEEAAEESSKAEEEPKETDKEAAD